ENVGLLGLTHIGSRRVVQISTAFMLFFSIFGKFGAFFASIPLSIFAAIYCVLFGLVAATGTSFVQFINFNSIRNLYILGLSLFLGISIPQYFNGFNASTDHFPINTPAGWFNDIFNTIFSSPPTVAMIVATVLDNAIDEKHNGCNRGLSWWVPFQKRHGDVEEHMVGRDDFGQGRMKGGGIPMNGQGKPKKGRTGPRDVKRFRQSSEPDMDDDDDLDLSMR
ncbi:Nucleobase-ascorbate transporter, partial [Thalictrum thalictroides]